MPDSQDQFRVIQGGDPELESFLGAVERAQNPPPIDQDAVRDFVMNSDNGELLEDVLTQTLRLGRMSPEAEAAVQQDKQAIIASMRDPEVELNPTLAKRRDQFFQKIGPFLPLVNKEPKPADGDVLGDAVEAARKVIDDKKED